MADQPKTQHPLALGCEDCECWHWRGGSVSTGGGPMRKSMGECRRQSPQVFTNQGDERWPPTHGFDWCHELVPRKEADHAD